MATSFGDNLSLPNDTQQSISPRVLLINSSCRKADEIKVYKKRWYILAVVCLINITQNLLCNTWGPIQATARAVYDWDSDVIDLMAAWGSITYCVAVAPFAWLLGAKGLRISILLEAGLQFFGAAARCIPTEDPRKSTILMHFGQIIIGLSGGIAAWTMLSSTWFPPHQRTTATALTIMASYTGTALPFIIGPAFVDDVQSSGINKTGDNYILDSRLRHRYQRQMNTLFYVEAGIAFVLFLAVVFHFPAQPPKPPSHSAATDRVDFKAGLRKLSTNYNFLLLVFIFGASTGVYGGWTYVLDQNLSEFGLGVSQQFAGWLGFVAVMSGSFSGIIFSSFADHFSGHLKLFLIVFMAFSFFTTLLICYVFVKVIPFSEILLYIMFALSGFFLNGTIPFFYELAVEITYPVAEGLTSGMQTFANNFLQSIFLVVPFGNFGTKWMIWATVGTCAVSTILLLFVKETYKRSSLDRRSSVNE